MEVIKMEIVRSGFAQDGRGLTDLFVRQMAENTRFMMGRSKMRVPVRRGHPPDPFRYQAPEDAADQNLFGNIKELVIKEAKDEPGEVILEAEVELSGQLLADFKEGLLPSRSIGFKNSGTTPDGRLVGTMLDHLAILGKDPSAFPNLEPTFTSKDGVQVFEAQGPVQPITPTPVPDDSDESAFSKLTTKVGQLADMVKSFFSKGDSFMPKEVIERVKAAREMGNQLMVVMDEILAIMGDEGGEPAEPEMETDDKELQGQEDMPGKDKEEEELEAKQLAATKAQAEAFQTIAVSMELPKDIHKDFVAFAEVSGLDRAKEVFSSRAISIPTGDLLNTPSGQSEKVNREEWIEQNITMFGTSRADAEFKFERRYGKEAK